jgi:hypothetical protein
MNEPFPSQLAALKRPVGNCQFHIRANPIPQARNCQDTSTAAAGTNDLSSA